MKIEYKLPFCKGNLKRKPPFVRVYPSLCQEKINDSKFLETLINGEGKDLNLYSTLNFVYCAFSGNLPKLTSLLPPIASVFSWRQYFKVMLGHIRELLSFPDLSHVYKRYVCY